MTNHTSVLNWSDSSSDEWTYYFHDQDARFVIFELPRLPNFAEPRFSELGNTLDDRRTEVARRQLQMLRQLHAVESDCSLSLRLRKDGNRLRLFVLVRTPSSDQPGIERFAQRIQNTFPKEYNFQRILHSNRDSWVKAIDLSSTRFIDVLLKPEERLKANTWPYFYATSLWRGQATHDLETLARTILRFEGDVIVDITLIPATFGTNERDWVDVAIKAMRQAQNGERLTSREDGRLLQVFEPMPGLRVPVENYENLLKRYAENRLFLYAFRVLASSNPVSVTQALISGATSSKPQVFNLKAGDRQFEEELQAARDLNITPNTRSQWWDSETERPFRAQRLHRLADIDEIASFWRLPIPVRAGYPGFELDIGQWGDGGGFARAEVSRLSLGAFTDDTAKSGLLAEFNVQGLAKHGLVVGVPGSGKTTTMFNLLNQLWASENISQRIPFIVLEPAKTEYRALKTISRFKEDLLVFTLGDERTSPFRFNPFEVPEGIPVETHISRLNACFVGAFNLFDPLPLLLDRAIRQTYEVNGWYDDTVGGELGLVTPTLSDLVREAQVVVQSSGYSDKMRDDFNAALLQRLESLRRGSKGRMLDTRKSISFDLLMSRPIILELDSLNEDEKALMMMFILTFVYEYAKANRRSGSPLCHVLVVEEAHNLIGRGDSGGSEFRANPKDLAIRLFTRMLAEMRALGQGILIADQLPTALAPEAVKQTNLKVLMRMTARDDREEIGNTMDLDEAALKAVTRFKSGQALVYLEEWDRVRQIQTPDFKKQHSVEEPPDDESLSREMHSFESGNLELYMPFPECTIGCKQCKRRVRSQAERFVRPLAQSGIKNIAYTVRDDSPLYSTVCRSFKAKIAREALQLKGRYSDIDPLLPFCSYVHLVNLAQEALDGCKREQSECSCRAGGYLDWFNQMLEIGKKIQAAE